MHWQVEAISQTMQDLQEAEEKVCKICFHTKTVVESLRPGADSPPPLRQKLKRPEDCRWGSIRATGGSEESRRSGQPMIEGILVSSKLQAESGYMPILTMCSCSYYQ